MIDFSATEEDIRIDAGDVFAPVWTFFEQDGTTPEDISMFEFDFKVLNARTSAVAVTAMCTVLEEGVGQVQTTIAAEDIAVLDPKAEYRFVFRLLSLDEPTTILKGNFRVMP